MVGQIKFLVLINFFTFGCFSNNIKNMDIIDKDQGEVYSSFDLFSLNGIELSETNLKGNYVIVQTTNNSIRVLLFNNSEFIGNEEFMKKKNDYIQEDQYQNEGKELHRIISYRKDTIITIVLSKVNKTYYLEEIKEEIKLDSAIVYISKFFNSVDKVILDGDFYSSFNNIYQKFNFKKADILWEYNYKFIKGLCLVQRTHKQYEKTKYVTFFQKTECHEANINEYFWLDRNPLYKVIDCK
jgi:hypothetical protein